MGLRLTADEVKGVQKRAPSLSTTSAQTALGTLQGMPQTRQMTAGGAAGAIEKVGMEQTQKQTGLIQREESERIGQKTELAEMGQGIQEEQDSLRLNEQSMELEKEANNLQNQLTLMDSDLSDKLIAAQSRFERDEIGRVFFNERQLADYAVLQAKSQDELETWAQNLATLHQRRLQMLQAAHQKIEQEMQQRVAASEQDAQQALQKQLSAMRSILQKKMQDAQTKAAETSALLTGVTAVAGGLASIYNPAIGAAITGAGNVAVQAYSQSQQGG